MSGRMYALAGVIAKGAIPFGIGAFLLHESIFTVEPGYRAVVFNMMKGIEQKVRSEGAHFRIPYIQQPIFYDVRTQPRIINTETGSKDLQTIQLSLRILARPNIPKLPQIYKQLNVDFLDRVLPSLSNEVLKQVVAQYDADQLLTLRDAVSKNLADELKKRCRDFDIEVDDVSITHLAFSKDFAKAIEDKQVAEQMAERAKFIVQKAEQEKLASIIRAEGDAEAANLISEALHKHGRGVIEVRKIETAQTIADTLSSSQHITYLPSSSSTSGGQSSGSGGSSNTNFLINLSR